jgi:hypothetical protein
LGTITLDSEASLPDVVRPDRQSTSTSEDTSELNLRISFVFLNWSLILVALAGLTIVIILVVTGDFYRLACSIGGWLCANATKSVN